MSLRNFDDGIKCMVKPSPMALWEKLMDPMGLLENIREPMRVKIN